MPQSGPAQQNARPMPRAPVFDWSDLRVVDAPGIRSIEGLPNRMFTTSGRAAIYHALLQLRLPAETPVLVPTYHCPTMVAPIILAGLKPLFFGMRPNGLPDLQKIDARSGAKAMIVPHYFGLAQSFAEIRAWCDRHGVALIEDCAHCYFGEAGERPAGAWGDYATASLSKFLPVPEAGLLASAHHTLVKPPLRRAGLVAQVKGAADVLEFAAKYRRLAGLNSALNFVFELKNGRRPPSHTPSEEASNPQAPSAATMMRDCDMGRIEQRPLAVSMALKSWLPRGRIIARRQRNFALYAERLHGLSGGRALFPLPTTPVAPYVFPLWVDDADRAYHALRTQEFPVFRWDRIWPGTPALPGDSGPLWSRHVLQLLCHQDLSDADIARTCDAVRRQLAHP